MSDKPKIEVLPIEEGATVDPQNINKHTQRGGGLLENELRKRGAFRSIASAGKGVKTPVVYAGNFTLEKAVAAGYTEIINVHTNGRQLVNVVRDDLAPGSPEAIALGITDNEIGKQSYNPDIDILAAVMADPAMQALKAEDKMLSDIVDGMGLPTDKLGGEGQEPRKTLSERFGVPPFSVLNARGGLWQDRKRAWIALGIQSELGRGDSPSTSARSDEATYSPIRRPNAAPGGSLRDAMTLENGKTVRGDGKGRKIDDNGLLGISKQARSHYKEVATSYSSQQRLTALQKTGSSAVVYGTAGNASEQTGTSIFDPVLCELAYRWFMPVNGGSILDPFAGGSVRGVVASILGKDYTGVDLSARQIEANEAQGRELCKDKQPRWINGDSTNIKELAAGEYDFIFSCPPYADLEVYSDDPADLSRMEYEDFLTAYRNIIKHCVSMLKDNRFACFVVGDIRDSKGFYRNFPAHTIDAFQGAGMILYNEAILVTAIGSLPIRVGRQFDGGRKLGKTHQNVLVFYKGNPKAIKDFGAVEFGEVEELQGADEVTN